MLRRGWLVILQRLLRSLAIHDHGLPLEEQRLLRRHHRLVWGTALALYAAALGLGYLIDPAQVELFRWLLAWAVTFVLVVLTVTVLTRLSFSERVARLRDVQAARGAGEPVSQHQDTLRTRAELEREIELFVTSVSHDLRGPLTTIKGYAQLLQRQVARSEAAVGAHGLQRIEGAASRATAMLDELGDLRQLQAGRPLELRYEQVDLLALIRDVLGEFEQLTTGHTLRLEGPLTALVGEWDGARVARVLGNLVSNAVKYSPAGGQIVVRVWLAEEADGPWAVVAVRDQGVGISAAEIPHVFELSYRGSQAAGPIEGSGIGLAGARWIVEQHGGMITVESQPGVGSTFTVRLPLMARPQVMPAGPEAGQAGPVGGREAERAAPAGGRAWPALPRRWAFPPHVPLAVGTLIMPALVVVLVLGLGGWILRLTAELATLRQIGALLAQSDTRPLEAADAASSARGRAYVDPASDRVLVVVSRLPELSAGRAYQLWFVRPDGGRDSGGTFQVGTGGDGTILARAPGGLAAHTAIGITEEPASGSPQPTGSRIVGARLTGSS